jgi:hypothetical protein
MSPRLVIAALLFASSAACAYGQTPQKTPAAPSAPDATSQSHGTTHPSRPIVRPFSGQGSANDPTGGNAVLAPPTASIK